MMQILPEQRLEYIKQTLKKHGIRFHVAHVAEISGIGMSTISPMLKGKTPVSENVWEKFVFRYPVGGAKEMVLSETDEVFGIKNPQPGARDSLAEKTADIDAQSDLRNLVTSFRDVLRAFEGIESKLDEKLATLLKVEEHPKARKLKKARKSGKI